MYNPFNPFNMNPRLTTTTDTFTLTFENDFFFINTVRINHSDMVLFLQTQGFEAQIIPKAFLFHAEVLNALLELEQEKTTIKLSEELAWFLANDKIQINNVLTLLKLPSYSDSYRN